MTLTLNLADSLSNIAKVTIAVCVAVLALLAILVITAVIIKKYYKKGITQQKTSTMHGYLWIPMWLSPLSIKKFHYYSYRTCLNL